MSSLYDIAIVGSGFAGSLLATISRELGRSVLLVERGSHPRAMTGESSTPLSNLLLEQLATRYNLPAITPLAKWGTWRKTYPELSCGLKRGFTFHHHSLGHVAQFDPLRRDQLLVAASPCDNIADTHWYRADIDQFLARMAQASGVKYVDGVTLSAMKESGGCLTLSGDRDGTEVSYRARFVVDASGPRGFLHHALTLGEAELPDYPSTQALYSHFTGVGRLSEGTYSRTPEAPPYPVDDAAVHHVFEGGWVWVLQFNNGITSAGAAVTDHVARELGLGEGAPAWERLADNIPALREQFSTAAAARPFSYMPRIAFRSAQVAGSNWALLPSAAGFVDPLLSTGFPLTLLGVGRLAGLVEECWGTSHFEKGLRDYARVTEAELLTTGRLIAGLYSSMGKFSLFTALSLLYFAAASYSESARRLNKSHLASSFLLQYHPVFGPALRQICERALNVKTETEVTELIDHVIRTIEPFNVAGLGTPNRRNWYAVEANDLRNAAWKLESSRADIDDLIQRCGFIS